MEEIQIGKKNKGKIKYCIARPDVLGEVVFSIIICNFDS
jgi:hypothetical protein